MEIINNWFIKRIDQIAGVNWYNGTEVCLCQLNNFMYIYTLHSRLLKNMYFLYLPSGAEDDEWDDEWDDMKSTGGYTESESGDGGAMQRGGAHATSMKISLNK